MNLVNDMIQTFLDKPSPDGHLIEPLRIFIDGEGNTWSNIHHREDCYDPLACGIHNPTPHDLRKYPLVLERDRYKITQYRVEPDGTRHVDPDYAAFRKAIS